MESMHSDMYPRLLYVTIIMLKPFMASPNDPWKVLIINLK